MKSLFVCAVIAAISIHTASAKPSIAQERKAQAEALCKDHGGIKETGLINLGEVRLTPYVICKDESFFKLTVTAKD